MYLDFVQYVQCTAGALSVSACILCVHIIGNGHGHMHVRSHLLLLPAYLSACEFLLQEDIWHMAPLIMRSILR